MNSRHAALSLFKKRSPSGSGLGSMRARLATCAKVKRTISNWHSSHACEFVQHAMEILVDENSDVEPVCRSYLDNHGQAGVTVDEFKKLKTFQNLRETEFCTEREKNELHRTLSQSNKTLSSTDSRTSSPMSRVKLIQTTTNQTFPSIVPPVSDLADE